MNNLRIAVPCEADWETMAGDARVRHCTLCNLNVYNFAEMTRFTARGSKVKLKIERVATPQAAVFRGVVRDLSGYVLPGVSVSVRDEISQREVTAITDVNGAFAITSLTDGLYRVDVMLPGFKSAKIEHVQLKASEVTHARVALRPEVPFSITVGGVGVDPLAMNDGISTTFSKDFLDKLP